MSRLVRLLTRPLWREDARTRAARRLRHLLVTPVTALAGVIWGVLAAPVGAEVLGWALGGALGFSTLAYLYMRLEPAVAHLGAELWGRHGWIAGLLWDWFVVGGFAFLLIDVLGMPTFGAVSSAVLIGGSYALALAWFFDEGGSRTLLGFMSGGWGRPRIPFSHIESMLARNDHEAALAALEDFVDEHPRDARGWITLGRLLDRERDDPDQALRAFRDGLATARLTVEQKHRYVFEIARLCASCDVAERAVPDLERFIAEHPDTVQAEWARRQLEEIGG